MSKIKKYLIGFGVFTLLLMILSLLISKEYSRSAKMTIMVPQNYIYNVIKDPGKIIQYHADAIKDTSFQVLSSEGSPLGNKSINYRSDSRGIGSLKIDFDNNNDSIVITDDSALLGTHTYTYKLNPISNEETEVVVDGKGQSGFFCNLWKFIPGWKLNLYMESQLNQLNELLKSRYVDKLYNKYKIKEVDMSRKFYIALRSDVNFENIQQYYTKNISSLYQKALNNKLVVAGMPNALFYKWDVANSTTDIAAALPILAEIHIDDTESVNLAPGLAVMTQYIGESSQSGRAHEAIDEYILDRKYRAEIPIVEEYMTDPTKEPDPNKWVTNIFYYVTPK